MCSTIIGQKGKRVQCSRFYVKNIRLKAKGPGGIPSGAPAEQFHPDETKGKTGFIGQAGQAKGKVKVKREVLGVKRNQ